MRTISSLTSDVVYDEVAALLETNTTGTLNARYTNYPGGWGGLASQNRSGTSSFYGCDSQTSVRILVSSAGAVTDQYSNKAFGEPLQNGSSTTNPYRYDGLMLYYYELNDVINAWNRWPRPSTGQWRSPDALWAGNGAASLYGYAYNRPLDLRDPTGNSPDDPVNHIKSCLRMTGPDCFWCVYDTFLDYYHNVIHFGDGSGPYGPWPRTWADAATIANKLCGTHVRPEELYGGSAEAIEYALAGNIALIAFGPILTSMVTPCDSCTSCGVAIYQKWEDSLQHECNHPYTHCMIGCTMTRFVNADCALSFQHFQNTVTGDARTAAWRFKYLQTGIDIANGTGQDCNVACRGQYGYKPIELKKNSPAKEIKRAKLCNPYIREVNAGTKTGVLVPPRDCVGSGDRNWSSG